MKPEKIDGVWRVVYDERLDWVRRRGLGGKPVSNVIFTDIDDAQAYIDKLNNMKW